MRVWRSMRCLLARSWPSARHDQAQSLGTDKARAARGRKKEALGCQALLLQVRGDWAWYKALFGFKGMGVQGNLVEVQSQLQ